MPHPNACVARAIKSTADFAFEEYLPHREGKEWLLCDVCDGHVLLKSMYLIRFSVRAFPDLAVFDPLSRKHLLLPPIRDEDLLASVQVQEQDVQRFKALLVPCTSEEVDETSFRVIAMMNCSTKLVVFVFSSVSGRWSIGASTAWNAPSFNSLPEALRDYWYRCGYDCFYWKVCDKLMKLDITRMEFSLSEFPPDCGSSDIVNVEEGNGRVGLFRHKYRSASVDYYTTITQLNVSKRADR
ncbi:hypothetical protein PR202_ga29643 [Eleusine coracana subsp. coracana]|uniref:Uncharacterized protein n=1 Tax=Eleusine coracana subsp. coracana TaxID=191504 RepID=A0AAV5DM56_ELECO|nr:hypothetical protein PR202_ga29643 [Eleusine coracana subsp. coracana]